MTVSGLLRWTAYPAVMVCAFALLWTLLRVGASIAWAPYAAVLAAGSAIFGIEHFIPCRKSWRPTGIELADDSAFMIVVQVFLPLALGWIVVRLAQPLLIERGWVLGVWPVSWPIWAQVLLKLSSGDFLRYWIHRWSHQWSPLWRLHAVHHHPSKLYSMNVFRFHPADKALQFVGDSLPFILLGVGPLVLAYYFVLYATSGFFQHSNCDLRLGWLNYLVSGPELHRWHHSQRPFESNHNYAHTLIIWDLFFGTYFWPKGMLVGPLGLLEKDYPPHFPRQMLAPFVRRAPASSDAVAR